MSEAREMYGNPDDLEIVQGESNDSIPVKPELPQDPTAYIVQVEKWMEFLTKLHKVFYKCLNPYTDLCYLGYGDKQVVFLTKSGNDRLLAMSGGEIRIPKDDKGFPLVRKIDGEDDRGKWFAYEAAATFIRSDGKQFDASYMVSSRNKFFGIADGRDRPATEILPDYVREAAIGWAIKKAITKGLGLGHFTIAQLKDAGVDISKIKGYTFQQTSRPQPQQPKPKADTSEPARIGNRELTAINKYCAEKCISDADMMSVVGSIGYERLADLPMSKFEQFKKELKAKAGE